MKHYVLCLALALTISVALSIKCSEVDREKILKEHTSAMQERVEIMRKQARNPHGDSSLYEKSIARIDTLIAKLQDDLYNCVEAGKVNQKCKDAKKDLTTAFESIHKEQSRVYPDSEVIIKRAMDISSFVVDASFYCNDEDMCTVSKTVLTESKEALRAQKDRSSLDKTIISILKGKIALVNELVEKYCGNSGVRKLAEAAMKGGRFLAKILRH